MAPRSIWQQLTDLAIRALEHDEVPISAALVRNNEVISLRHNEVEIQKNPLAHAEMLILLDGFSRIGKNLSECDLYVTLEPCPLCAHAIKLSKINRLYFGAYNPEGGAVEHGAKLLTHSGTTYYGGYSEIIFSNLLKDFFQTKRR